MLANGEELNVIRAQAARFGSQCRMFAPLYRQIKLVALRAFLAGRAVHGDPADPRTDDMPGDVVLNGKVQPDWGLHLIDVGVARGNLIDIVHEQSSAYLAKPKRSID
jgi:hypothetical protein